ncbi:MAG TPA: cyclase family protein [Thermoanaerobaculia bacterium]|jgi:kynurenine formamidase
MTSRLVDLSHDIEAGMITYAGLPAPLVSEFLSREASASKYSAGTTFSIGRVEMVANTGTYIDAPFHRFEQGVDVAALPLEKLADLPGIVVDASAAGRAIGDELFDGIDLAGVAVLVRTGWSRHWRTPAYFEEHPYLTRASAERLVAGRPALVGIDSLNIDDTGDGSRPAHTLLLQAEIPIVEHLTNLDRLPAGGFRFHCVPAPFRGLGSFPVRAYAIWGQR